MLIGISGKINSGKDLVFHMLLYLELDTQLSFVEYYEKYKNRNFYFIENKKCAETLKNVLCLLLGCTREQLEDREFKEKPLGEEWWYYKIYVGNGKYELVNYLVNDKPEGWVSIANPRYLIKPTPRLLLQLLGTECGRNIIHPNVWVNSLFSTYSPTKSNWVVTDIRFPNEADKILELGGTLIRLERPGKVSGSTHESETALDNYKSFDTIIVNDGDITDLYNKIVSISHTFSKLNKP